MTSTLKFTGIVIALFLTIFALAYVLSTQNAKASAGSLPATMASSSVFAVSSSPSVLVATSTNCTARIISTASSSIMIQFTEKNGGSPNAAKGFWQAASTTVAYDSALYGCGAMQFYSFGTQQITYGETF